MTATKPFLPDAIVDMAVAAIERGEFTRLDIYISFCNKYSIKVSNGYISERLEVSISRPPFGDKIVTMAHLGGNRIAHRPSQLLRIEAAILDYQSRLKAIEKHKSDAKVSEILERLGVK